MKSLSNIISELNIGTDSKVDVLQVDDYNCDIVVKDEFNVEKVNEIQKKIEATCSDEFMIKKVYCDGGFVKFILHRGVIMSIFNKKLFNIKKNKVTPSKVLIPQKEEMLFNGVNMDINNKCNQRCRFCFNSFNEDSVNMDLETYSHMLEVIPFVKNYSGGGMAFIFHVVMNQRFIHNF